MGRECHGITRRLFIGIGQWPSREMCLFNTVLVAFIRVDWREYLRMTRKLSTGIGRRLSRDIPVHN
jgi:hypothetical protein